MNIELLPNELLIHFFKYLSTVHLLRAFDGLNSRFNGVLLDHFRVQGFDFQSIRRLDFDIICRTYLPRIIDQITSIRLADDERTPGQIDQFFKRGFALCQFTHLQSLSVYHLRSEELAVKIIGDLQDLPNFCHLIYKPFYFPTLPFSAHHFISAIWGLKKLKHCCLAFQFGNQMNFPISLIESSSIEYLSLEDIDLVSDEIVQLLKKTANLRYLSVNLTFQLPFNARLTTVPQITKLNITYLWDCRQVIRILTMIPSLCELKLNLGNDCIDGHKWEQIIRQYLIKLKVLHFRMMYTINNNDNKEQQIDKILDTFRTHFWLDEHHWFVQCNWNLDETNAYLYTLPYAFEGFSLYRPHLSKTTYPHENKQLSYNSVRSLAYHFTMAEYSTLPNIQFLNITNLSIKLPIGNHFWSTIPDLYQIKVLFISLANDDYQNIRNQLQILLNQMPCLSTLVIKERPSSILQVLSFEIKEISGCYLDLLSYDRYYNNEQCITLTQLQFVIQCKSLSIAVEDRTCVVDLINAMNNLQALNVLCRDDKWNVRTTSTDDELVEWFKQHLPSSCIIRRNRGHPLIGLWIR